MVVSDSREKSTDFETSGMEIQRVAEGIGVKMEEAIESISEFAMQFMELMNEILASTNDLENTEVGYVSLNYSPGTTTTPISRESVHLKEFIWDTGASCHIFSDKSLFKTIMHGKRVRIKTGAGDLWGTHGTIKDIEILGGEKGSAIIRGEAIFCPQMQRRCHLNILGARRMIKDGWRVKPDLSEIYLDDCSISLGNNNVLRVYGWEIEENYAALTVKEVGKSWELHKNSGHRIGKFPDCDACNRNKTRRRRKRPKEIGAIDDKSEKVFNSKVVKDTGGPINIKTNRGFQFADVTECSWTRWPGGWLKKRNTARETVEGFKRWIRRNGKPGEVRCDNGVEFRGEFEDFCVKMGIKIYRSTPYEPWANGRAEALMKLVFIMVRIFLQESNLPETYWGFAFLHAIYLLQRTPHSSLGGKSPYFMRFNEEPKLDYLKPFGEKCFYRKEGQLKKLDSPYREGILVGYDEDSAGYRVQDVQTSRTYIRRSVKFPVRVKGGEIWKDAECGEETAEQGEETAENNLSLLVNEARRMKTWAKLLAWVIKLIFGLFLVLIMSMLAVRVVGKQRKSAEEVHAMFWRESFYKNLPRKMRRQEWRRFKKRHRGRLEEVLNLIIAEQEREEIYRFGKRYLKNDSIWRDEYREIEEDIYFSEALHEAAEKLLATVVIPLGEALAGSEREEWRKAIDAEFQGFKDLGVYELASWDEIDWKGGERPIPLKVILELKDNGTRKKCRAVCDGSRQRDARPDNFSPVASGVTLKLMLLKLIRGKSMGVGSFDISSAFLRGFLDKGERVFVKPPAELVEDKQKPLWRLKKSLYGLKISAQKWYEEYSRTLIRLGYTQGQYDPCYFFKDNFSLLIYVDDTLLIGPEGEIEGEMKRILGEHGGRVNKLEEKDGVLSWEFLGLSIRWNKIKGEVFLSNEKLVNKILKRFSKYKGETRSKVPVVDEIENSGDSWKDFESREVIGSLLYLSTSCRPDLSFAVTKLSKFVADPRETLKEPVGRLLNYLEGTKSRGLLFNKDSNWEAFCDASFADGENRKSTSGFMLTMGCPIYWKSQQQRLIAFSTMEAELIAMCSAVRELKWLRSLILEVMGDNGRIKADGAVDLVYSSENGRSDFKLKADSMGAIFNAERGLINIRTKAMDIRHEYIREQIDRGIVSLSWIPSRDNLADGMTKPPKRFQVEEFTRGSMW